MASRPPSSWRRPHHRPEKGASLGNVSISSNAIKNSGLGSFSVTGSAIILDGANSKVIISGN